MRRGTGARACEILASMASSRLRPWEGKRIRRECSTFCAHDLEAEHCAAPPWRWASSPGITNFSSAWRSATLEELTLNPASLRFHLHLSAVIRKPGLCGLARLGQRLRSCVSHTLLSRHRGLWERSFRGLPAAFRVLPGCHFLLQCMKVKSQSEVPQSCQLLATPWTAAYQHNDFTYINHEVTITINLVNIHHLI